MRGQIFLAVALLMIGATTAAAAHETCLKLLEECQAAKNLLQHNSKVEEELVSGTRCLAYLEGFLDGVTGFSKQNLFCLPPSATLAQGALVYVRWADQNPEELHRDSALCLTAAMGIAFPCTEKSN